ncbi:hypothetical protein K402DRAFT_46960 [Aulographum hederae CBS 113979]|uniref:Uncharacterized protein n=1 Tax=Aulographum hederae CBS 113979 TaxID=1176131 RepID=A0A6G1H2X6_9PEZI|nr:hypothetical protein K402DRAFT_46960 [Aulographum hederae CBS 113979]
MNLDIQWTDINAANGNIAPEKTQENLRELIHRCIWGAVVFGLLWVGRLPPHHSGKFSVAAVYFVCLVSCLPFQILAVVWSRKTSLRVGWAVCAFFSVYRYLPALTVFPGSI